MNNRHWRSSIWITGVSSKRMKEQRIYFMLQLKKSFQKWKNPWSYTLRENATSQRGKIHRTINTKTNHWTSYTKKDTFRQADKNIKGDQLPVCMFSRHHYSLCPLACSEVSWLTQQMIGFLCLYKGNKREEWGEAWLHITTATFSPGSFLYKKPLIWSSQRKKV